MLCSNQYVAPTHQVGDRAGNMRGFRGESGTKGAEILIYFFGFKGICGITARGVRSCLNLLSCS